MNESFANLPRVVARDEWTAARKDLLAREKQFTRERDALNADRRRLPMVRIEKAYEFEGPDEPSKGRSPRASTPVLRRDLVQDRSRRS